MNRALHINHLPDAGDFQGRRLKWDILNAAAGVRRTDGYTVIDLSQAKLLRPYSVACLAAIASLSPDPVTLVPPADERCSRFLDSVGLGAFFPDSPFGRAARTSAPVRQILDKPGPFADEVMEVWETVFGAMAPGLRPELSTHLDELIRNAVTHAESPVGCFVAGQAFPEKHLLEIAVLDLGVTIKGHLSRHPGHQDLRSDREAIQRAMREAVTGTVHLNRWREPNSGAGLTELSRACRAGLGELTILSGDTAVVVGEETEIHWHFNGGFRGTLVNVQFRVDNPAETWDGNQPIW